MKRYHSLAAVLLVPLLLESQPASSNTVQVPQVELQVRFAEISRQSLKQIGINLADLTPNAQTFAFGQMTPDVLNWLLNPNITKVLAEPQVVTSNDKGATFSIGGPVAVPIAGTNSSVDFEAFGISLSVTPRMTPDKRMSFDLVIQSDQFNFAPSVPIIDSRLANTMVEIPEGQSLLIGGLISNDLKRDADRIPGLGDVPILGQLFRGTPADVHNREAVILVTPNILASYDDAVGDGWVPTGSAQHAGIAQGAGRQIDVEAKFVEVQADTLFRAGIDFRRFSAAPGSPLFGSIGTTQLQMLNSYSGTRILTQPRVATVEGRQASLFAGGLVAVASGAPGVNVQFNEFGFDVTATPRVLPNGRVNLDVAVGTDTLNLFPGIPTLATRQSNTRLQVSDGQSVVIGGLLTDEVRRDAGRVPGLGNLPVLGTLFRGGGTATQTTELVIIVTPFITGVGGGSTAGAGATIASSAEATSAASTASTSTQTVRTSSSGTALAGAATSGTPEVSGSAQMVDVAPDRPLLGLKPGQFYISGGAGVTYQFMPSFDWLRLENDERIASESTDIIAPELLLGGGMGLRESLFGGRSRLSLSFSYIDGDTDSEDNFISANNQPLEIIFPGGSVETIPDPDSDLENVNFSFDYKAVELNIKAYEEFSYGEKGVTVGGGLTLRYTDSDTMLSFLTDNQELEVERSDDIDNYSIGPVIGGYISHNYGPLMAYGGAEFRGLVGYADGTTSVDLDGLFDQLDPSKTAFIYELGLKAGTRFDFEPLKFDIHAIFDYGNNNPVIEYQADNEAKIKYKDDYSVGLRASAIYKFD